MLPIGNRLYCSVLQIHPNWRISPSCIFSAKSCWGVFSPHISHPFSAAWIEAHQPTASVESISPPCTQPRQWGHALWHWKGGRNRERKCRIPHISPPPPTHFVLRLRLQKGGVFAGHYGVIVISFHGVWSCTLVSGYAWHKCVRSSKYPAF